MKSDFPSHRPSRAQAQSVCADIRVAAAGRPPVGPRVSPTSAAGTFTSGRQGLPGGQPACIHRLYTCCSCLCRSTGCAAADSTIPRAYPRALGDRAIRMKSLRSRHPRGLRFSGGLDVAASSRRGRPRAIAVRDTRPSGCTCRAQKRSSAASAHRTPLVAQHWSRAGHSTAVGQRGQTYDPPRQARAGRPQPAPSSGALLRPETCAFPRGEIPGAIRLAAVWESIVSRGQSGSSGIRALCSSRAVVTLPGPVFQRIRAAHKILRQSRLSIIPAR